MKIHDTSDLTHRIHGRKSSFLPWKAVSNGAGLSRPTRLGPTGGADRKYGGAHVIGLGQQLRGPMKIGESDEKREGTHGKVHHFAMASYVKY